MTEPLPKPWTVEDFLEWEAQQPERYEFIDGRILGMVGGSAAHATIKDNVAHALRPVCAARHVELSAIVSKS
jgi:Uma2 family endonuclease